MRPLLRQQSLVCRRMLAKHIPNGLQFGGQGIEHGVLSLQVLKSAEQNGADLLLIKHNGASFGFHESRPSRRRAGWELECLVFRPERCIFRDLREYRVVLVFSNSAKSAFGPVVDLFGTRQLVELTTDFLRQLLDFLPLFLLVQFIADQGANVVIDFMAELDSDCHWFTTPARQQWLLHCQGRGTPCCLHYWLEDAISGLGCGSASILSNGRFSSIFSISKTSELIIKQSDWLVPLMPVVCHIFVVRFLLLSKNSESILSKIIRHRI